MVSKMHSPDVKVTAGDVVLRIDENYFRPSEVDLLIGDCSKTKAGLNWQPEFNLEGLIMDMVDSNLALFKRDSYLEKGGHTILQFRE